MNADLDDIVPGRTLRGKVSGLLTATGAQFTTEPVDSLDLTFAGIEGDRHAGATRRSGGREPWYPRGTEISNSRQLTILAVDELAAAAAEMGVERIAPEWIGGNVMIDGISRLSMLPAGTLLFFADGATLKVDGQNAPCRASGAAIAAQYPDKNATDLSTAFVRSAKRRRGLVAWVEKPGRLSVGEAVRARLPEQWIYRD